MKRTLSQPSIELLLEELEYEKIHTKDKTVSTKVGSYLVTRTRNTWELEKHTHDKQGNLTSIDYLVSISDTFYHADVAMIMLNAIKVH